MKHIFYVNPAAGKRDQTELYRAVIDAACSCVYDYDYEVRISEKPGDITAWARAAAETGESLRLYACGGDGTLNELVNGVAGFQNVAVTHFPGGSGNDFLKLFSDPKRFEDLVTWIDDPDEACFDLIRCNDDYSLNICSVGLDARIGTDVAHYKRLPLLHGFRAYAVSAVINVVRGVSEHYVIEVNGETIDGDKTMVCICNGRYYGGGFNPVPEADPSDALLDVLIVEKVSRLKIAQVVGKYKNGQYADYPNLIRHYHTDRVRIRCDKPACINLDGELRTASTIDIRLADEKLRFFYPKGLTWQTAASKHACAGSSSQ